MKKCAFINPYFGKLPKTFPVFLKTCEKNPDFEWLFFTDDESDYDYPQNVKRILMTFDEMRELAQSKFDFPIVLNQPYKLCDYKPAYGLIFEDYIKEYRFWGHCDVDTIMGNLGRFIDDKMLDEYDKIFCLGHMILYRNSFENNRVFMKEARGRYFYKESFTTEKITAFDETWDENTTVNTVFVDNGYKVMMEDWSVNFQILPTRFTRVVFNPEKYGFDVFPYERAVYVWDNGDIKKYYMEKGKLCHKEELYMHFQSRDMKFSEDVLTSDLFKIVPNRYCALSRNIDCDRDFYRESRPVLSFHYFQLKWKRFMKRMKKNG
ncbi:DUF6625 family protein [Pseudobutyrivibrio xylanivorans]|uniref:Uncharacterized protein n=1 Tax=Pseudobutyrivibrio xylanivorans DSM 14809 TaxID=1123012 RepID=A0A1M6I2R2_PSEXY|nr:DUF6625 family protein [Pseudobutyrivibrio xylanivorans]SHJ28771.1 hypothetical protein SAMN02745725_02196 [Pseudobutyrivibrio xylanivorans DSM 14809]